MCGPISSVKEQTLPHYAERLADAGYTVLTFDSRSFGESEGQPRQHYDPNQMIADYGNAVGYLVTATDVEPERIAAVGVCMGGGYAVSLAALDKRVKAVASVAGGYNIGGTFQRCSASTGSPATSARSTICIQRQPERRGAVRADDRPASRRDPGGGDAERRRRTATTTGRAGGRAGLVCPDDRGRSGAVLHLQRGRPRAAGGPDAAPDRPRHPGFLPAARVRAGHLRRGDRPEGAGLDRDAQPHRAVRPGPVRRRGGVGARAVARRPPRDGRRRQHRTPGRRPPAPRRERPWPGTRVARCCPWSSPWGWWSPVLRLVVPPPTAEAAPGQAGGAGADLDGEI